MPQSKKYSLKAVALAVNYQVTNATAQCLVSSNGKDLRGDHFVVEYHISNMGRIKKQGDH